MASKFITLEYEEYLSVYRCWKHKINHNNHITSFPWNLFWKSIGLEYYESLPNAQRKFKILDHDKWMHHWMLVKIKY